VVWAGGAELHGHLQNKWIQTDLDDGSEREAHWNESVPGGSELFVRTVQDQLGIQGRHRQVSAHEEHAVLREPTTRYPADSPLENELLRPDAAFPLNLDDC